MMAFVLINLHVHSIFIPKHNDEILLTGDLNAEEWEAILSEFMELYDLKNLVKEKTCFKSVESIDVL